MKLFLVVYIFGKVAAAVGPLPYGMETCQRDAIPMIQKMQADGWAESVKNGKAAKLAPLDGRRFRGPVDTANKCEWHDHSPVAHPISN